MNELIANASASLAPPQSRDLRDRDQRAQSIIEDLVAFYPSDNSNVVLRREPTQSERQYLRLRQRDLHGLMRALSVEDRRRAGQALAAMFLGFPNVRAGDSEATIAAYIMALQNFPLFAVLEACADVTQRRVDDINPDFAPTAPRMCDLATRHMVPLRAELALIEKTLTAQYKETILSPEERERVKKGLTELAEAMMERDKVQRRMHMTHQAVVLKEINTQQILREYQSLGIEPIYADADRTILLSPELAGKGKTR